MKLSLLLPAQPDDKWTLARQIGVSHAVTKAAPELTGQPAPFDLESLRSVRDRFGDAGITLIGLEGDQFDMRRIKLGLPGRDEDIDRYRAMLRNMGQLGLNLLCYNFMPRPRHAQHDWHRTRIDVPARGGALTTAFDLADAPRDIPLELPHQALWDNYAYFIRAVMPVAEEAGVKMGLHPDDPPLPALAGMPRIFHAPEAFDRAYALHPSPNHGVTFCQATFRMMGVDVAHWARRFAAQGRLFFVHMRDAEGTAERFVETFHDNGPTDMAALLRLFHEVGFDGAIRPDHAPALAGEANDPPGYAILGRMFAVGYLRGMLHALEIPSE